MFRPLSAVLVLAALAACNGKHQPTDEPPAAPAESDGCALKVPCALSSAVTVTVTEVNDSRCPKGAQCMWAGDAAVTVSVGGETLELHSNPERGAAQASTAAGATLVLEDVVPYPDITPAPADSIRVRLRLAQ